MGTTRGISGLDHVSVLVGVFIARRARLFGRAGWVLLRLIGSDKLCCNLIGFSGKGNLKTSVLVPNLARGLEASCISAQNTGFSAPSCVSC